MGIGGKFLFKCTKYFRDDLKLVMDDLQCFIYRIILEDMKIIHDVSNRCYRYNEKSLSRARIELTAA